MLPINSNSPAPTAESSALAVLGHRDFAVNYLKDNQKELNSRKIKEWEKIICDLNKLINDYGLEQRFTKN